MKMMKFWALLLVISSSHLFNPGHLYAEEQKTLEVERLVGETLTQPVRVQGADGITIVFGNTIVNFDKILTSGPRNPTCMLDIRPSVNGGRIFYRNNRIINKGRIIHLGAGIGAMTAIAPHCQINSMNNYSQNSGRIQGIK